MEHNIVIVIVIVRIQDHLEENEEETQATSRREFDVKRSRRGSVNGSRK